MEKDPGKGKSSKEPEGEGGKSKPMSQTIMADEEPATESMSSARKLWYTSRSRQKWKSRSAANQKKIRALENKVRDLTQSRNDWREKTERALEMLRTPEKKTEAKSEKAEKVPLKKP